MSQMLTSILALICPVCNAGLVVQGCKKRCHGCGYFEGCSE